MLLNKDILENYNKLALAVSGGPDSIAMLFLLKEFSEATNKEIIALTVNHNLRDEASEEAAYVSDLCKQLDIKHFTLEWVHEGINSNVHDKARKARYDLMTNFCNKNSIEALCTAHHQDDRIENFFIRIHQGASLLGLIDKDHIIYNNVNVIRPLFHAQKTKLVQYLENKDIKYFTDKSNSDPKYLRSNIRKWLNMMPKELDPDLFKKRIISVKDNLERSSKVIDRIFEDEFKKNIKIYDEGYAYVKSMPKDEDICFMVLSKVLSIIGQREDKIRLDSIKELHKKILENNICKKTLAGCLITKGESGIIIYREFGKSPPIDVDLNDEIIWDNRFRIGLKKNHHNLKVSYLKFDEYVEIKKQLNLDTTLKTNKEIIFTLPIVKNLEKVIAIPHINYYDEAYADLAKEIFCNFIGK